MHAPHHPHELSSNIRVAAVSANTEVKADLFRGGSAIGGRELEDEGAVAKVCGGQLVLE